MTKQIDDGWITQMSALFNSQSRLMFQPTGLRQSEA